MTRADRVSLSATMTGGALVHTALKRVDDAPAIEHYVRTKARALSTRERDVQWYEITVVGTEDWFVARVTAHLPSLDVIAEHDDADVFLAVRDTFDDLDRKLWSLREP